MQTMLAHQITQAVILAAGLGTRLRPLTDMCPKPMLPINGTPLLEHLVVLLRAQGITDFIFNLHYFPEQIRNYFVDGSRFGVAVKYSDETEELLDTAGALKKMEPLLNDNFLFMYGDQLHAFDFAPAIAAHTTNGATATVILKSSKIPTDPSTADILEFDPFSRRVVRCYPRPHAVRALSETLMKSGGLYVLSKKILDTVPAGVPVRFDRDVIPRLVTSGETVLGFPTEEPLLDIGTVEKYRYAEEWHKKRGIA